MSFTLITPRCILDAPTAADLPALRAIATTPSVGRMLFLFSPGMSDADFAAQFPPRADVRPFRLAIRRDGRVIGSIGVGAGPEPPVYYFLAPEAAGQGIASEIVPAFCDAVLAAFPEITALTAGVFADNPASARVLARAGFTCEGQTTLPSAMREAPAPGTLWRRQSSSAAGRSSGS